MRSTARALRERENVRWVELRSPLLSAFYGHDVYHRAGVALPWSWIEDETAERDRKWPALYIVPGYGGRATSASRYGGMLATRGIEEFAPMAVHIVLDPESPLGHH